MITLQLIQQRKHEIEQIAAKYGAHNLHVFGSVARGEAGSDSDLDLLVDFEPGRSLVDLSGLLMDLQEMLDMPLDVGTEAMLHARIREHVLREAVPL